jgi:hypothetical protein
MRPWLRAHGTTAAAILIATALAISFGYVAVQSLLDANDPDRIDSGFRRNALAVGGSPGGDAGNASAIAGVVIGAVVIVCVLAIIGLALRRQSAREASIGIFGFLGVVATLVSIGGLFSDPPAPSAWLGLLSGIASLGVAVLLLLPATAEDFENREMKRARAAR